MSRSKRLQECVHFSLLAALVAPTIHAADDRTVLPEVVVTAQKRTESIQDVPIAVSAISGDELISRGLDGGRNIVQAVPNVTFSKGNFTGFNLQIRGIGSKLVAAGGDGGVGIHVNNAPLPASRFFESEFFDMERVEVLRGPQGTLYGRNATGGVFNAITAKPSDEFEGNVGIEAGNYETRKVRAMVNLPMGEMFAFRLAGSYLERRGYNYDIVQNTDIDGRELYGARATLSFKPFESLSGYLMWEHFDEDDNRQRAGAQLCTKDVGPASIAGQSTTNTFGGTAAPARSFLSQGCLPGSLFAPAALGTLNTNGALGGIFTTLLGTYGDLFANQRIDSDLRITRSAYKPRYSAGADLGMLNIEWQINDELTLTSLTARNDDEFESRQDYNRSVPLGTFNPNAPLAPILFPGGFFNDPQTGRSNTLSVFDKSFVESTTWTQELRLQSAFDGPLNFNVGAIYIDQDAPDQGYFVFFNTGTAYAQCFNLGFCNTRPTSPTDPILTGSAGVPAVPIYIDPNVEPTGEGHNYYLNKQTFALQSLAAFGELYWNVTDDFKATLGLRYTDDKKEATSYDFNQQFIRPGRGFAPSSISLQEAEFKETTGRAGFDWKLGDTLLYAFYSRGYKGGGFNPATARNVKTTFDPEFVNAIEVGSKSTFADGRVIANLTLFTYKYDGYQISRIVNLTSVNDNIDADIEGAELEFAWQPIDGLRFDGNLGYLKTEITGDVRSIDVMNRTQGNPALTVIKGFTGTNCVAPTATVAQILGLVNATGGLIPATTLPSICPSGSFPFGRFSASETRAGANYLAAFGITSIEPSEGVPVQVAGNELPNSPEMTINLGAQYTANIASNWSTTFRADYYHQSSSFARIFNTEFDRLEGWSNVNASIAIDNEELGLSVLLFVKNLLDDDNITDAYLTDDSSGLFANTFLTDPRLFGASVTYRF